MTDDLNTPIIDEVRANHGVVGGHFKDKRLVLLHTLGHRSGKHRVIPLVAATDDNGDLLVAASNGGATKEPVWVANLDAMVGCTKIEVGDEIQLVEFTVIRATDAEWARVYGIWATYWPASKEYEARTERKFPIVRLHRIEKA